MSANSEDEVSKLVDDVFDGDADAAMATIARLYRRTAVMVEGRVVSSCHRATIDVRREVSDTVTYDVERVWPVEGDGELATLNVSYAKVYEGEGGGFSVTCTQCGQELEVEVEES